MSREQRVSDEELARMSHDDVLSELLAERAAHARLCEAAQSVIDQSERYGNTREAPNSVFVQLEAALVAYGG